MVSLDPLKDYVLWALKSVLSWIIEQVLKVIDLDAVLNLIPSFAWDIAFFTADVYSLVTQWFPLGYALSCFGIYVTLALIVYGINWILGFIPTVS